jgi:hypothetical protein
VRDLNQGPVTLTIRADRSLNDTGLELEAGVSYAIQVSEVKGWRDAGIAANPSEGHDAGRLALFRFLKRYRKANWFVLIGQIGKKKKRRFVMGGGLESFTAPRDGRLFVFANDAPGFYWNNHGTLKLTVVRLP